MQKRDYYEILCIEKEASQPEVKKAYRRLAHKYHPDRNQEGGAEDKFKEVSEAYQVLSDPQKRHNYDTFGHSSSQTSGWVDFDPFDIFKSTFGGFSRGKRRRGRDIRTELQVNLKDVLTGTQKDFKFERQRQCETCKGLGGHGSTCDVCGGYGQVRQQNGVFQMITTCPQCRGSKVKITNRCKNCKGQGSIAEHRKVTIKVPPGVQTGTQIRVTGEGDVIDASSQPGDLLCVIKVRPHSQFERSKRDLQYTSPITFTEACLGATIKVPTLDGKDKDLKIPPGTQFGQVFRVEKQGVPALRDKKNRGDLYVKVKIEVPKNLGSKEKNLLKRFDEEIRKKK